MITRPGAAPRRVPPELGQHAAAVAAGTRQPAEPRDAATVVLLRDATVAAAAAPGGVEAYLLRRVPSMAFAAGMHVFPGGSVDPRDADIEVRWAGPPAAAWTGVLSAAEPLARALVCAAVRETFEESGVLLAGPTADTVVDLSDDAGAAGWEAERQALLDRSISLAELLARRDLVLRADLLRPWAHWITPEAEPRRFDTRFFVAALPARQATRDVGGEADRAVWLRAADAVRLHERGELDMLPPTLDTLAGVAAYDSVDDVLSAAGGREITPVLPRIVVADGDTRILLPGEPGYDR